MCIRDRFYWQRGLQNQPADFEKTDFNDSEWVEIKVPSLLQTEGYSVPYYYASTCLLYTSPGLSKKPAAYSIDIDENGNTVGLF